ncbi:MAG: ACT domain-containing protein [Pseudomonadota bacterium]
MTGETNLRHLLGAMEPALDPTLYVFASSPTDTPHQNALVQAQEDEGITLILPKAEAERQGLDYIFPCRRITLSIHSSLEAVGFLAAILPPLAAAGIGVNPVSGTFHDHLFVPADRAEEAMQILRDIATSHGTQP